MILNLVCVLFGVCDSFQNNRYELKEKTRKEKNGKRKRNDKEKEKKIHITELAFLVYDFLARVKKFTSEVFCLTLCSITTKSKHV
jgi:hypothetical protein